MSVQLYSEDGFVADVASNFGYTQALLHLKQMSGAKDLKEFLRDGKTDKPQAVVDDIKFVLDQGKGNMVVRLVFRHLLKGMQKVKEIGIIQ